MRQLRMVLAVLLVFLGLGNVVDAVIDVAARKEPIRGLAKLLMGGTIAASGWLVWHVGGGRRVGAMLLIALGSFSLVMGLREVATGTETAASVSVVELRVGVPAALCGLLLLGGHRPLHVIAALLASWSASFTLQAVAYSRDSLAAVAIIARAGVPGLICAGMLWRGTSVRDLAAVLLVSWPTSYLIYALSPPHWDTAVGELMIGLPTILVGWLLWRERRDMERSG